jgi:hypothetical protein
LIEGVDKAKRERNFGAYDGERWAFGRDYVDHGLEVVDVNGNAAGDLGDSSVAGGADDLGYIC